MSSSKIYNSQQFQYLYHNKQCPKCHQHENIYIQLGCNHIFCIICLTFAYLKYKNTFQDTHKIKCLDCQEVSQIDEELLDLINDIIQKELGPIVKNQSQNNQSRMSINQTNGCSNTSHECKTIKNNIKSQEASLMGNQAFFICNDGSLIENGSKTPNKSKFNNLDKKNAPFPNQKLPQSDNKRHQYYYSRCQSPKNDQHYSQSDRCQIHPNEQISYICMSCSVKPLCYKCIKNSKHQNHEVKIIKKAIQQLMESMNYLNLQTTENIENIQLVQKRIYDRKGLFQERIQKNIKQIKSIFNGFIKRIQQNFIEAMHEYKQIYEEKIHTIQVKCIQTNDILNETKSFKKKIQTFIQQNSNHLNKNFNNNLKDNNKNNFTVSHNILNEKGRTAEESRNPKTISTILSEYQEIQRIRNHLNNRNKDQLLSINNKKSEINNFYQTFFDSFSFQNSEIKKYITFLGQMMQNINFKKIIEQIPKSKFNSTTPYVSIMKSDILFNKNKTIPLRNCSSRQKLHKNQNFMNTCLLNGKKNKYNFPKSLNTSRDKRQKKFNTKTQQDQRRHKSKANYKTQANSQIKQSANGIDIENVQQKDIPSYITKCIQKHNNYQKHNGINKKISPFNSGTFYLMQNLQNSKNTSKIISKTSNPHYNCEQSNVRKKNIKQTINLGSNKQRNQKKASNLQAKNSSKLTKQADINKKKR